MISTMPAKSAHLHLIKPSCYDDEGYVVRHFRGVLPSNTLACLAALTESARTHPDLRTAQLQVRLWDETVMRIDTAKICREADPDHRTIVGLVGVQTHQFPRAADLAREFRAAGLTVLIGGFHVSGQLAMNPDASPEIRELIDLGVTVVQGEVEEAWAGILADAVHDRLLPLYDLSACKPDLSRAPIPLLETGILKRFVASDYGTVDCGRGCPFECSFCTIINVQGRKMRFRQPESIAAAIRENWHRSRVSFYFFTDDNFARNRRWSEILDELIHLREEEGIPVEFMMQVDVLSYRTEGFIDKARRAGCSNVFIGMESLNDDNLQAAGKRQNKTEDFRNLIAAYRDREIATHVGYILGFPFDTPESVQKDIRRLMHEVEVDMASFFILTPLPGSRDHQSMLQSGARMDADYNRYDSQHETMDYPGFPVPGSLQTAYQEAWETFYGFENLRRVLKRVPARNYWNLFQNFMWYRSAALIEKRHPMTAGFLRLKGRTQLRPGVQPMTRFAYLTKRVRELSSLTVETLQLIIEMQLLWLETRRLSQAEQRVMEELAELRNGSRIRVKLAEVQSAYRRARQALPSLQVPSRFRLFVRKWNPLKTPPVFYPSADVLKFWRTHLEQMRRGRVWKVQPKVFVTRLLLDLRLTIHFAFAWMRSQT